MKIVYCDMTKFFVKKSFYKNGDFRCKKNLLSYITKLGRKNGCLE